ncbi:MAG: hypothetical protein ACFFAV_12805 [Candidatus Hermodarchaeota archaeon]
MKSGNKDKILEIINEVENKNSEIEQYLSNLKILPRNEMLKEITRDIISKNSVIQEFLGREGQITSKEKEEELSVDHIIEGYYEKIQNYPSKKIIFLREYLELFQDRITDNDKDVILNSLKDEKNKEKLKERMKFLANTFELNL